MDGVDTVKAWQDWSISRIKSFPRSFVPSVFKEEVFLYANSGNSEPMILDSSVETADFI